MADSIFSNPKAPTASVKPSIFSAPTTNQPATNSPTVDQAVEKVTPSLTDKIGSFFKNLVSPLDKAEAGIESFLGTNTKEGKQKAPSGLDSLVNKASNFIAGAAEDPVYTNNSWSETFRNLPNEIVRTILPNAAALNDNPDLAKDVTNTDIAKEVPTLLFENFVAPLASFAQTFYGITNTVLDKAGLKTVGGTKEDPGNVSWSIPGLGKVTNMQARLADDLAHNGVPSSTLGSAGTVAKYTGTELLNGLFAASLLSSVVNPRLATIADISGEQSAQLSKNQNVLKGENAIESKPRSFQLYQKPTMVTPTYTKLSDQFVDKLTSSGIDMSKYDPSTPTFFKFEMEPNGQITGKVVQVKPSFLDEFTNLFKGDITKVPPEELKILNSKGVDINDIEKTPKGNSNAGVPSNADIHAVAEEVKNPAPVGESKFKPEIDDIATNFRRAVPEIKGINPEQETKLTPEEAQPLANQATDQYWRMSIKPVIDSGGPVIIGGDNLKDFFGKDYNDNNHPVYSQAADKLYERALQETKGDTVIFTGGGPASGKTELVTKALISKGFNGIIYDSNLSNYDGAARQIQMARDAGKKIEIHGIIPNLDATRTFSILRENETGRGISDQTFAHGHSSFPQVVEKLLENNLVNPNEIKIYDTREITTFENAMKMVYNQEYLSNPLETLKSLGYKKEDIKKIYGKENYNATTGQRESPLPGSERASEAFGKNRATQENAVRQRDEGLLGEIEKEINNDYNRNVPQSFRKGGGEMGNARGGNRPVLFGSEGPGGFNLLEAGVQSLRESGEPGQSDRYEAEAKRLEAGDKIVPTKITFNILRHAGFSDVMVDKLEDSFNKGGFKKLYIAETLNGQYVESSYMETEGGIVQLNPLALNEDNYINGNIVQHEVAGHGWYMQLSPESKQSFYENLKNNRELIKEAWSKRKNRHTDYYVDSIKTITDAVTKNSTQDVANSIIKDFLGLDWDPVFSMQLDQFIDRTLGFDKTIEVINRELENRGYSPISLQAYGTDAIKEHGAMIAENASELIAPEEGMLSNYIEDVKNGTLKYGPTAERALIYQGETDLSTTILEKLKGRDTVSKTYISELTNSGDVKQVERDLIRDVLAGYPDGAKIPVAQFAKDVKIELLPLKINEYSDTSKYESIVLPDDLRGNVADYKEHIFESPIKTSAGQIHFSDYGARSDEKSFTPENYFGHTRIEDMAPSDFKFGKAKTGEEMAKSQDNFSNGGDTRRVIEVQSDLYQKGNLEKEIDNKSVMELDKNSGLPLYNKRANQVDKLRQYNDPTAHFRMVREEVKQAAKDGKTKLQFPSGETAMKIEGLGNPIRWTEGDNIDMGTVLTPQNIKVGMEVNDGGSPWIITDVLGDGKFKAVQKQFYDTAIESMKGETGTALDNSKAALERESETFDISGKVDTNNPIYKFYEKDLGRYLKNKYGAKPVTDDKGVTWYEVDVKPSMATAPVVAFRRGTNDIEQLRKMLERNEQSLEAARSNPQAFARAYGTNRIDELKTKNVELRRRIAEAKNPTFESGDKLADARNALMNAEKRVNLKDSLETKLDGLNDIIDSVKENIDLHPGKVLQKFVSKKAGAFKDFGNPELAKTDSERKAIQERNAKVMKAAETAFEGTNFSEEFDNPDTIREEIDSYKELKDHLKTLEETRIEIRKKVNEIKGVEKLQNSDAKVLKRMLDKQASLTESDIGQIVNSSARKTKPKSALQESISISQQSRRDYLSKLLQSTYEFLPKVDSEKPEYIDQILNSRPITLQENELMNNSSLPKMVIDTNTPVKYKVGIHDYLRTPDRVLKKIGLGNIVKPLRFAYESYLAELPVHMELIKYWANRVPDKDASKRIFRYLDGQTNKDYYSGKTVERLSPKELEVAGEIKTYLEEWAERLGLPEDKRLSHYITHIFDIGANEKEFDEDIAKIIDKKVPGSVYDPFLQERLGKKGYIEDVFKALEAYTKRAVRKANMDPILERIKENSKRLELSQEKYVKRLVDKINFRPTEIENLLDNTIKQIIGYRLGQRPIAKITGAARKLVFRAFLGLNVKSAIKNLTQGVNTYAKLGEKYTLIGYTKLLTLGTKELEEVGILGQDMVQDRTVSATKKVMQRFDDTLFYFFELAEKINRGAAYYGAKSKAIAEGKSEMEAVEEGKKMVRDTQFQFGAIDTPVFLNDSITKTLGQFLSFAFKQSEFVTEMARNKEWAGILRYIAASLLLIFTIGKALNITWKDFIPFYSIFARFGQVPPVFAFPLAITQAVFNTTDQFGNTRSLEQKGKDIAATIPYPGKSQIEKTVSGIMAIAKNETQGKADAARALFFGANTSNTPLVSVSRSLKTNIKTAQTKLDGLDKDLVAKVKPIFDQAKTAGFGTDEADALIADLTDSEYTIYKDLKAKDVAETNLKLEPKVLPIVQKASELGFGTDEADKLVADSFPETPEGDAEYAAYLSIKNSLYGKENQKNTSLGEWDKQSFITHISNIAQAVGTDPVTAFNDIFAGNGSWRIIGMKNGQVIVQRMSMAESEAIKKKRGGNSKDLKLDHSVSLEAGGNNGDDNLQLIPTGDENTPGTWAWNTGTENVIGEALGEGIITGQKAREYMVRFKATAGEELSPSLQKEFKEKYNSEPLTPDQIKDEIINR